MSTETALLKVTSDWRNAIDRSKSVCVISLDVSAAFDAVNHDVLLNKLSNAGVKGGALSWFSTHLKGRTTSVRAGTHTSRVNLLTNGVPQGSTLGPLLLNTYMADLAYALGDSEVLFHIYADDIILYVDFSATDIVSSFEKLQSALTLVEEWMANNFLLLSPSKTGVYV
jgi:hypothetical protein